MPFFISLCWYCGIEFRASCMLAKCSATEWHLQPLRLFFFLCWISALMTPYGLSWNLLIIAVSMTSAHSLYLTFKSVILSLNSRIRPFKIFFSCSIHYLFACVHTSIQCLVCLRNSEYNLWELVFPSTWVVGVKLRSSELTARTLTG